jgi:hypothetical protein
MEHIKQHIALWYLNRMEGYIHQSLGQKLEDYELITDPKPVDKMFGAASQHVDMDAQETLQGIMPIIQQMVQQAQQFKPKPDLTPDGQVLLQTSMAETQRRTERDKAELQLKGQEMQQKLELQMLELQQKQQMEMEDLQLRMAIAVGDQETKERIETARLTRDAARLKLDQDKTIIDYTIQ